MLTKTALVTGASQGLDRAIVKALAAQGVNTVAFLASPRACYITGAIIHVDGGMRRHAF